MSSFRAHLCSPSDRGNKTEASRPLAPTPPRTQQQLVASGSSVAKRKKVTDEKRKQSASNLDSENPRLMDPSSFMAASWEMARVEQANRLQREIEVAMPLDPTGQEGGCTPDLKLVAAIKQFHSHL